MEKAPKSDFSTHENYNSTKNSQRISLWTCT